MTERVPVGNCQWKLAYVWFAGAAMTFLLLLLQTITGKYGEQGSKVWSWFLPTVLPTLTLMVGSLVYAATSELSAATVDNRMFTLSLYLSGFYLLLVLAVPLTTPFTRATPVEWILQSNLWLAPVQGLVTGLLGAFFVSKKD